MRIPIVSYIGNSWKAIVFYSEHPDVYNSPPPNVRNNSKHAAHVQYSYGNVKRGLDVFLLEDNIPHNNLNVKKVVRTGSSHHENVDQNQGIKYEFLSSIRDTPLEKELTENLRFDIDTFCRNPAVEKITDKKYSKLIIPITKIKFNNPKKYVTSGKHDYVRSCLYRGNVDFSTAKSECMAGFIPGDSFGIKSSFDGNIFTGFFNSLMYECLYCYAGYQHKFNAPFPKTLIDIDKNKLEHELRNGEVDGDNKQKQPIRVLRLGKRTEVGSIYTRKQLIDTLETAIKIGTRIVMPTKALEFDKEVSDLFKKSNSSILYSEGDYENVQTGLVLHGYTQEFRKEQARLYREAGNNVGFFLLIDAPYPPTPANLLLMEYARKHDLVVQLLPIRIPSREVASLMLGKHWSELKGDVAQSNFDGEIGRGGYITSGNHFLTPKSIHSDWLNFIGDNKGLSVSHDRDEIDVRMCHHVHGTIPDLENKVQYRGFEKKLINGEHVATEFCGSCLLGKVGIIVVPETRMKYTKKQKGIKKLRDQHKMNFLQ